MATNEYVLAEKLKSRFYLRDEAMAYARTAGSAHNGGSRKRVQTVHSGVREKNAGQAAGYNRTVHREEKRGMSKDAYHNDDGELIIKNKLLNPLFVACLVIITLMLLTLVTCFSQVYQTANEVSTLEKQLETLKSEEEDLTVRLDAKNDMRKIETIATTKLGMIKEDSIQKRFVSLSEGEHIDLVEENMESETTGGVMLSSVFASIGKFFDKLK